ncbi:MAG TPA: ATP-binding cassette domain-containing protein [Vicinamibacterales bacterium]|nr:ATP-binding cassette domain-containing protein [Vicinamibacterales bacterium]
MSIVVSVRDLVKNYNALRPLRVKELVVQEGQVVSIAGVDASAAELFVGLLTGALLPDAGEIRLFDKSTADVTDSEAWLAMLDGVGIVAERAVLIQQFSIEQNIAMPFTLEIDPIGEHTRPAVESLAREVGLPETFWRTPVGSAGAEAQARVRIARALALGPRLLIAEHPSATLPRESVERFGRDLAAIATRRKLAVLALTGDEVFARALGGILLTHEPATGALKPVRVWRRFFG